MTGESYGTVAERYRATQYQTRWAASCRYTGSRLYARTRARLQYGPIGRISGATQTRIGGSRYRTYRQGLYPGHHRHGSHRCSRASPCPVRRHQIAVEGRYGSQYPVGLSVRPGAAVARVRLQGRVCAGSALARTKTAKGKNVDFPVVLVDNEKFPRYCKCTPQLRRAYDPTTPPGPVAAVTTRYPPQGSPHRAAWSDQEVVYHALV